MDFYIDIKLKPDAEMRENVLMNKVYSKFHKALFDMGSKDIGVSFPQTRVLLGKVLRIHSTEKRLVDFYKINWLGGLSGYCDCSSVLLVPTEYESRRVSRWQSNMSEGHLRRLIKRLSISNDEIRVYRAKMFAYQMTTLPFLELESTSSHRLHRRYIQMSEAQEQAVLGDFDTFGLSKVATIPWF